MRRGSISALALAGTLCWATVGGAQQADVNPNAAPRTHELLQATLWVQGASEYRAAALQAYRVASTALDRALEDPAWTALLHPPDGYRKNPPAVIVDIDETVLDNSPYQARLVLENGSYGRATWSRWANEARAIAVPGALAFCRKAAGLGVTVFYVTNRRAESREGTRKNLAALGFPLDAARETILTRGRSSSKIARRAQVAKTHRVLLLIGDNANDFAGDFERKNRAERDALVAKHAQRWGERWILLPNPMYGSWESALLGEKRNARGDDRLRAKLALLDPGVGYAPPKPQAQPRKRPREVAAPASTPTPVAQVDTTGLAAGPMPAYAEMTDAAIWLQTKRAANVQLRYWPLGTPHRVRLSPAVRTDAAGDHIARFELHGLASGQRYDYEVYLDGRCLRFGYPLSFQTQPQWRYRTEPPPITFLFGSCAFVNEPAFDRPGKGYGGDFEIFDAMAKERADFMVWVGDNTYLRGPELHSEAAMRHRYRHTRAFGPMQRFLASTHHYAIWDDHDYGPDNSDRSFRLKDTSLRVFADYWPAPRYGTTDTPGCFHRFAWGDVEFFLLDDRTHRSANDTPISETKPYLGAAQLDWLLDGLRSSRAAVKFVVNGNQVLNDISRHERFTNYPELRRLIGAVTAERIDGVVFLSGDRHISELIVLKGEHGYPLYDFTSSPLTSGAGYHEDEKDNPRRVPGTWVTRTRNFGRIAITGPRKDRRIVLSCHDKNGNALWRHELRVTDLRAPRNR